MPVEGRGAARKVNHLMSRRCTVAVPTTGPRIMVTETDELTAALDAAARHPGLGRAQLLTRLALEGHDAARHAHDERRRHRLDALRAHSGSLTGAYGSCHLERLHQEWLE